MSRKSSLVSVIIIFLNAEKFMEEAIASVLAQTYDNWELLLVDDGSTDASTQIAQRYVTQYPEKVYYLEHSCHQNRGKGASRNLGIRHAKGKYIAFLDADDIWLPLKLEQQVAILEKQPEAGMLYGDTKYWYSWTGNPEDVQRDFVPKLGVQLNILIKPPKLLPLYLRGKAAVPCTCSILVRREVVEEVGGFEEAFQGIYNVYEDQAFYAKVCLKTAVLASNTCWDGYRQHPDASVAVARKSNQEYYARQFFLKWLEDYLSQNRIKDVEVQQALQKEIWLYRQPAWLPFSAHTQQLVRWTKKWLLRSDEFILYPLIRRKLWSK
jgi:glycosyltransferase involved in cell wall biosynthesis